MKIAIISPNPNHLNEAGRVLSAKSHQVELFEGGKSRMRAVAEQSCPDLMLVDGMCCDPEELSLVEQVTTQHPHIAVILMCSMQTPEFLRQSMRAGVREVLPSPADARALEAAVAHVEGKMTRRQPPSSAQVVACLPCKGGSGATFLATNLACCLAQERRVLLIDLNLQFGSALAFASDEKPASSLADIARDIGRLDASLLAGSCVKVEAGFDVLAGPEDLARASDVKAEHIDAVLNVASTVYDFVILDVGLNLNSVAIRALDRTQRIYGVMQPTLPALRNAVRLQQVFKSLGYPATRIEMVVNRFDKTSEIGLAEMRRLLGGTTLHTLTDAPKEVTTSINRGTPLALIARSHPVSRGIAGLALALSPRQEDSPSLLGRLFRRA